MVLYSLLAIEAIAKFALMIYINIFEEGEIYLSTP